MKDKDVFTSLVRVKGNPDYKVVSVKSTEPIEKKLWRLVKWDRRDRELLLGTEGLPLLYKVIREVLSVEILLQLYGPTVVKL